VTGERIHVVPLGDLREHIESTDCWCRPQQDAECGDVFVHKSADGREAFETGERKPS
jgi:hypothetical protein